MTLNHPLWQNNTVFFEDIQNTTTFHCIAKKCFCWNKFYLRFHVNQYIDKPDDCSDGNHMRCIVMTEVVSVGPGNISWDGQLEHSHTTQVKKKEHKCRWMLSSLRPRPVENCLWLLIKTPSQWLIHVGNLINYDYT